MEFKVDGTEDIYPLVSFIANKKSVKNSGEPWPGGSLG